MDTEKVTPSPAVETATEGGAEPIAGDAPPPHPLISFSYFGPESFELRYYLSPPHIGKEEEEEEAEPNDYFGFVLVVQQARTTTFGLEGTVILLLDSVEIYRHAVVFYKAEDRTRFAKACRRAFDLCDRSFYADVRPDLEEARIERALRQMNDLVYWRAPLPLPESLYERQEPRKKMNGEQSAANLRTNEENTDGK